MKNPRYSIIIPHHNVPDLLKRLLDTIPYRNDTEIIIVDDNSDPSIVDFNQFPGSDRDDVVLRFDKKGGYGGYARNIGLSMSKGEWILFADSDDFFTYCFNEILDDCYSIDDGVDLVFFPACSLDSVTYTNTNRAQHLKKMIDGYSYIDKERYELLLRYKFGEPWCKLARKNMIDKYDIRFEERSIHNDTAYSYLVGFYAREISVCQKAIYCITDRNASVSKVLTESKKLERIENFGTSALFFKRHNIPIKENRHFEQLFECYCTNTDTFKKGMLLLQKLGYKESYIKKKLIRIAMTYVKKRLIKLVKISIKAKGIKIL